MTEVTPACSTDGGFDESEGSQTIKPAHAMSPDFIRERTGACPTGRSALKGPLTSVRKPPRRLSPRLVSSYRLWLLSHTTSPCLPAVDMSASRSLRPARNPSRFPRALMCSIAAQIRSASISSAGLVGTELRRNAFERSLMLITNSSCSTLKLSAGLYGTIHCHAAPFKP